MQQSSTPSNVAAGSDTEPSADSLLDPLHLDGDGRITIDLPCACCGYNLRTLRPDGRCPECGGAVSASSRELAVWKGTPADRRCVRAGLVVWMLAAAVPAVVALPMYGHVMYLREVAPRAALRATSSYLLWCIGWRHVVDWSLGALAVLLIVRGLRTRGRPLLRWGTVAGAVCAIAGGVELAAYYTRGVTFPGRVISSIFAAAAGIGLASARIVAWSWIVRASASRTVKRWGAFGLILLLVDWFAEFLAHGLSFTSAWMWTGTPYPDPGWRRFADTAFLTWRPQYLTPVLLILWLIGARNVYWGLSSRRADQLTP